MDPRAVELSDIIKFHPTEDSLNETSIKRDDVLHVSKNPMTIYQRKNNGDLEAFLTTLQRRIIQELANNQTLYFGDPDNPGEGDIIQINKDGVLNAYRYESGIWVFKSALVDN